MLHAGLYTGSSGLPVENELMPKRVAGPRPGQLFLAVVVLLGCAGAGSSSGYEREQMLAGRLIESVETGEPVWLQADNRDFLALHHAALGALPRQAILLIHNMGGHPDWPEVIAPLRRNLPDHGWSTLSLQMPLLAPRALADDYGGTVPEAMHRIESGVEFLRAQDYSCVVLAGYGFGASQALAWLAERGQADGLITIGILAREFLQPAVDLPSLLARVDIPMLDIYGRNDFPAVVNRAHERRIAVIEQEGSSYEQRVIDGADHYFTDREQKLLDVVADWLEATFGDQPCASGQPELKDGRVAGEKNEP